MKTLKDYYGIDERDVRMALHTPVRQARNVYKAGRSMFSFKALGVVIYLFSFVMFFNAFEASPVRLIVACAGVYCLLFGSYLIINKK